MAIEDYYYVFYIPTVFLVVIVITGRCCIFIFNEADPDEEGHEVSPRLQETHIILEITD